jgi:hypothetical protein
MGVKERCGIWINCYRILDYILGYTSLRRCSHNGMSIVNQEGEMHTLPDTGQFI